MLIPNILINAIVGCLIALAWCFALHIPYSSGLLYGALIGGSFGVILFLFSKIATAKGNILSKEATYASGSFSGLILLVGIVAAIVAWVIKLIS